MSTLNSAQRVVLVLAAAVIGGLLLFPPFILHKAGAATHIGHQFLFNKFSIRSLWEVNAGLLATQVAAIALMASGLVLALGGLGESRGGR